MNSTSGTTGESQVFLLRVWREDGWRGRLVDLLSGEAFDFGCWPELVAVLTTSLRCNIQLQEKGEL